MIQIDRVLSVFASECCTGAGAITIPVVRQLKLVGRLQQKGPGENRALFACPVLPSAGAVVFDRIFSGLNLLMQFF